MALLTKDGYEIKKENGVATVTYKEEDAYISGTEKVTTEMIKDVSEYNQDYIKSSVDASAELAKEIMTEDKDIQSVLTVAPYGVKRKGSSKAGEVTNLIKREHVYPGINGNPDVRKSTIKTAVLDNNLKIAKSYVKDLEADLTKALLG